MKHLIALSTLLLLTACQSGTTEDSGEKELPKVIMQEQNNGNANTKVTDPEDTPAIQMMPKRPAAPLVAPYTSADICAEACKQKGYSGNGMCTYASGSPPGFFDIGDCNIKGSPVCGTPGDCHCFCVR